jgi:hypothetical protein
MTESLKAKIYSIVSRVYAGKQLYKIVDDIATVVDFDVGKAIMEGGNMGGILDAVGLEIRTKE